MLEIWKVHMQIQTVAQMRNGVRQWLAVESSALAEFRNRRHLSAEAGWALDAKFMRRLFDAGWNRWGWPELVGGLGGSSLLRNALYDELERAGYPVPEHYVQLEVQGNPVMHFAPKIAAELMPAALRGDEMWAQGFSEPEAGSDLASLRCRATRDGDHYVISGQKIWTSYITASRRMGVLVRTGTLESRHRGLTMLMLDLHTPGVEYRGIVYANGRNELGEVFFDDVRVPADQLIGAEGEGWSVAMYLLQFERANYAWMRQAHLNRRLLELAREVSEPTARAASTLGELWLANAALRARCGNTVRALSDGAKIGPEASIDKVMLGHAEQGLTNAARDLLPGQFLFADGDSEQVWRSDWWYSRAATIYGGAGEVQRGIIADHLLRLPKEKEATGGR
jgi:alkylation response protein AidB-like acyl-CoA dehydrogenase